METDQSRSETPENGAQRETESGEMQMEEFKLGSVPCAAYVRGAPRCLLVQPVGAWDAEAPAHPAAAIAAETETPFALVCFRVENWNRDLSPWPAPEVFGNEAFGDGAAATLGFLTAELLPFVRRRYALTEGVPVILGGYSLAGLFSLWCAGQTDAFAAVAAASPSVWFRGWLDYAGTHRPRARCVYLSLGDREEKTRNKTMAEVGRCIRVQAALLKEQGIESVLEWNAGGHFREPDVRCAKGFVWCMGALGMRWASGEEIVTEKLPG